VCGVGVCLSGLGGALGLWGKDSSGDVLRRRWGVGGSVTGLMGSSAGLVG